MWKNPSDDSTTNIQQRETHLLRRAITLRSPSFPFDWSWNSPGLPSNRWVMLGATYVYQINLHPNNIFYKSRLCDLCGISRDNSQPHHRSACVRIGCCHLGKSVWSHRCFNMWGGGGCQLVVQWCTYQDQLAIGKLKTVSHLSPDKPSAGNCQIILLNCKFLVFITILQILDSEIRESKYWISNSTSCWPGLQFPFKFEIWLIFLLPIFNYLSGVPEYMAEKSGTKSSLVSPVATQEE